METPFRRSAGGHPLPRSRHPLQEKTRTDEEHFDGLARRVGTSLSRRTILRRIGGLGLATLLPAALATRLAPLLAAKKRKARRARYVKGTTCQGDCFAEKGDSFCPGVAPARRTIRFVVPASWAFRMAVAVRDGRVV